MALGKTSTQNNRQGLTALSTVTGQQEFITSTSGVLNTTGGGGGGGSDVQYVEGATTAPATGTVALGRYQLSPPTLTTGQLYATQLDVNGNLKVAITGTATINSGSPTGSAVPANAFYQGIRGPSSNLVGVQSASIASGQFDTGLLGAGILVNGTSDFKYYSVAGNNAADAMATGISAFTWSQTAVYNGTSWDRLRGNTNGLFAQGNTDSATTDSGSPVKVGGKFNTTRPTFTDGQRGDIQIDARGNLAVMPFNGANPASFGADNADTVAVSATADKQRVISRGSVYNGTSWDRQYGDATNGLWVNVKTGTVGSNSPTGSAVPTNAFYIGARNSAGSLADVNLAANATNTSGNQFLGASVIAQVDDVSPTAITENNFGNIRMSTDRSLLVANRATTPAQTSVAGSATSTSLLAANTARKGATFTNESTAHLYLIMGATASTTSYSVLLTGVTAPPYAYYELPYGYVGAVAGIWATATGNCRITEIS